MVTRRGFLVVGVAAAVLWAPPASAQPRPVPPPPPEIIPGQFIVELKPTVGREAFVSSHGLAPFLDYTIINGFAVQMSAALATRLAADPDVRAVSPDLVVRALARPARSDRKRRSGDDDGKTRFEDDDDCTVSRDDMPVFEREAPAGVRRIGAEAAWALGHTGRGVKVAVIDTGIDPCHPDLKDNLKGGVNLLTRKRPPNDDNGHGTHVAGIIGARRNGFGVVGVAPRARLYAVKVLDAEGAGSLSTVIRALDWAARNRMQVANLSLGSADPSLGEGPMCRAVSRAVADGVTVVAAAGNEAQDALSITPANCVDTLAVSGFVDTDGLAGGQGDSVTLAPGVVEDDDTFAETFSNHSDFCWDLDDDGRCTTADSNIIDLMAPAVGVLSTLPTSPATINGPERGKRLHYDTLTGTSMAAPHVAGAAALFIGAHPGATPVQVRVGLTTRGSCVAGSPAGSDTCPAPWTDDPDGAAEPLVSVEGL